MKLNEAIEKINSATIDSPIIYFTNDVERSLGLENILKNYHIVCIDKTETVEYLKKNGIDVICIGDEGDEIYRSSIRAIEHPKSKELLSKYKNPNIQTFKISPRFENIVRTSGYKSLNTTSALNRRFENKISQFDLLKSVHVNFPKSEVVIIGEKNYKEIVDEYGEEFVIQFDRGHTGSSTIFVKKQSEFEDIKTAFPKRTVKISSKVEGASYTINCCISQNNVYYGGLSYQITGESELTSALGGTVGNDFMYRKDFDEAMYKFLDEQIRIIGKKMMEEGFRGMFGIDLIVADNNIYIIEVNARQTASVSFFTKIQLQNDQIPMSLIHLMEFLGIEHDINPEEYNRFNVQPFKASQVINRVKEESIILNGYVKNGYYRLQGDNMAMLQSKEGNKNIIFLDEDKDKPLIFQKEAYAVDNDEKGILILTREKGITVKRSDEICRIQILETSLDENCKLKRWVIESLVSVENYLR